MPLNVARGKSNPTVWVSFEVLYGLLWVYNYLSRYVYTEVAQNCVLMCSIGLKPKTSQRHLVTSAILCSGTKKEKDVNNRPKSRRIHDKFRINIFWLIFFPVWRGTLYSWNWLFGRLQIYVSFGGKALFLFSFGICCCFLVLWVWVFRNKWGHVVKMWAVVWEVRLCYCL